MENASELIRRSREANFLKIYLRRLFLFDLRAVLSAKIRIVNLRWKH